MGKLEIAEYLTAMAQIYDRRIDKAAALIFLDDLEGYSDQEILAALARCRKEMRTFPTVADVIARIDDGHPGVEEAWALVPKSEMESACWTPEIREAYFRGAHALMSDPIAARMAFKETYTKILAESKARKKRATWELSLGQDVQGRKAIAVKAIDRGLLPASDVQHLLEDNSSTSPELLRLAGLVGQPQLTHDKPEPVHPKTDARQQLKEFVARSKEQKGNLTDDRDDPDDFPPGFDTDDGAGAADHE